MTKFNDSTFKHMRSRFYKRQKRNGYTWSNFTRSERSGNINRRNFIKDLSVLPVSGVIGHEIDKMKSEPIIFSSQRNNKSIKIGIIGFGFRGEQLARATKHAHPDWIKEQEDAHNKDSRNKVLEDFYSQQELNIEIVAVCDVFDVRIERGIAVGGKNTQGFSDYRKLLAQKDIGVVIIATPDHWHMQMGIDASNAGKHVYMEKCMTRTAKEAVQLKKSIKDNSIVFQLGHQGRQSDLQKKAKGLYEKGTLGKVTLVETTTNRNNPFAAWIWPIHEKASDKTIDWERFQEPAPKKVPYNAERFFRWRCWWDYGTGMAGDLLTHDYDAVNHIMNLGIPHSATASGGIYFHKDEREVPDVFHANFEYPDHDLTLLYSGTLANGVSRGTMIMGHDATLELGQSLTVWADTQSTKYKSRVESGIIDPGSPIVRYRPPEALSVDAVTSATSKYFADRGLMHTYQAGRRVDTTNLHLAEWFNCIRNGGETSCNIEQGFQEAITAHMATMSYLQGRRVYWNPEKEEIII